jgi:hypothetical protein
MINNGNEKLYTRIELTIEGKKVIALFPNEKTNEKTIKLIKGILINSYIVNGGIKTQKLKTFQ